MNIIKKSLLVAIPVAIVALASGSSAQAYYAQSRSAYQYQYQPQSYVRGFTQPEVAVPRNYGYNYNYGYQYDAVRPLIQGQLNFVSQFTYYPAPIPQYFYQYYSPYNYYGW